MSDLPQEIHEPQSTHQQDAQEDQERDVREVRENLLPSQPVEETREGCSQLLRAPRLLDIPVS